MIETANQMHDNAEHYTEPGPVVDRLYTGLHTANQLISSRLTCFQIERIEMTFTTETEMSTLTKWKEKDQATRT